MVGEIILSTDFPRELQWKTTSLVFSFLILCPYAFLIYIFTSVLSFDFTRSPTSISFPFLVSNLLLFLQSIQGSRACIRAARATATEIGEKGIANRLRFIAWEQIECCHEWLRYEGCLEVNLRRGIRRTIQLKIPHACKDAVLEIMARFVEIRTTRGVVVSRPPSNSAENAPAATSPQPRQKHSIFQYDLLTLLLFMLVVASFSSWFGILWQRSDHLSNQMARLQEKYQGLKYSQSGMDIHDLDFSKCPVALSDDVLLDVETYPQLTSLYLPNVSLTDDSLVHLEGLTQLQFLDLSGKGITDNGLKHLLSLKKLEFLTLKNTSVTLEGVNELKKQMPKINILLL